MKLTYTLVTLFLSFSFLSFSQQMPIDFEFSTHNFNAFGNSSFSLNTDPDDSSNNVGQFFNDGTDPWQGFYIDLDEPYIVRDFRGMTVQVNPFQYNPSKKKLRVYSRIVIEVFSDPGKNIAGGRHDQ